MMKMDGLMNPFMQRDNSMVSLGIMRSQWMYRVAI